MSVVHRTALRGVLGEQLQSVRFTTVRCIRLGPMPQKQPLNHLRPMMTECFDMSADNDWLPSIPDGNYQLRFDYYETAIHFGKACKVILHFRVLDVGKFFETKLCRYYTVERLIGKPGRNGRFKIKGQTSCLITEFLNCHPDADIPKRLDRLPMSCWKGKIVMGFVSTVTQNSHQKRLHEIQRYSRIKELLSSV